jgi:hypothetical protein
VAKPLLYAEGFKNFERYIRALRRGNLKRIGNLTAANIAHKIADMVRARYEQIAKQSGTTQEWAKRATAVGKERGMERPARLPQPAGWGVIDQLAKLVEVAPVGGGRYLVRVAPGQTFAYHAERGPISHLMSDWIENPRPMVMADTHRARVYRIMMQEGRGGYGTRKRAPNQPNFPTGEGHVYIPPERPVWQKVGEDLMRPQTAILYTREMMVMMRTMARRFGAR